MCKKESLRTARKVKERKTEEEEVAKCKRSVRPLGIKNR